MPVTILSGSGLSGASEAPGVRLHLNMAEYYRTQIGNLRAALTEAGGRMQAAEIVAAGFCYGWRVRKQFRE